MNMIVTIIIDQQAKAHCFGIDHKSLTRSGRRLRVTGWSDSRESCLAISAYLSLGRDRVAPPPEIKDFLDDSKTRSLPCWSWANTSFF